MGVGGGPAAPFCTDSASKARGGTSSGSLSELELLLSLGSGVSSASHGLRGRPRICCRRRVGVRHSPRICTRAPLRPLLRASVNRYTCGYAGARKSARRRYTLIMRRPRAPCRHGQIRALIRLTEKVPCRPAYGLGGLAASIRAEETLTQVQSSGKHAELRRGGRGEGAVKWMQAVACAGTGSGKRGAQVVVSMADMWRQ